MAEPAPSAPPAAGAPRSGRRPNILLVVSDQERQRGWLPPGTALPWRDRLRAEGLEFTRYHTHSSPCSPSRASLFTGRYLEGHGVRDNVIMPEHDELPTTTPTLGSLLAGAGYRSSYIGKWHLSQSATPDMAAYGFADRSIEESQAICEEVFGRVLRDVSGMRERVVITSKCGIRWAGDPTPDAPHRWDFSREHIVWSCEQSLRRLGVEQLDLLLLHRPDFLADPLEIAMAFEQLRAQGKVREFGVSNFMPSTVTMLQRACSMKLIVNQIEVHLARLAPLEDGTLDQCLTEGITPMSWSPLARGLLGAGGRPQADEPRAAVLTGLVDAMGRMAERLGVSRGVLALARTPVVCREDAHHTRRRPSPAQPSTRASTLSVTDASGPPKASAGPSAPGRVG